MCVFDNTHDLIIFFILPTYQREKTDDSLDYSWIGSPNGSDCSQIVVRCSVCVHVHVCVCVCSAHAKF